MNHQLRIVTIRIENVENGGVRAWSDDLAGLSLTCPNYEVLFAELTPKIATQGGPFGAGSHHPANAGRRPYI